MPSTRMGGVPLLFATATALQTLRAFGRSPRPQLRLLQEVPREALQHHLRSETSAVAESSSLSASWASYCKGDGAGEESSWTKCTVCYISKNYLFLILNTVAVAALVIIAYILYQNAPCARERARDPQGDSEETGR